MDYNEEAFDIEAEVSTLDNDSGVLLTGYGPPLGQNGPLMSEAEVSQLILDHLTHGDRLAKSFLRKWRISLPPGYISSVVGIALTEAANRFDPTRGVNFKTFFFYHLKGMLVKEIRKMIDSERMVQYNTEDGTVPEYVGSDETDIWPQSTVDPQTPERLVHRRQLVRICWKACSQLDELEQEVLLRHYVKEQSMTDIAKDLGYSRCHISRVKSFALVRLEKMMRQLRVTSTEESQKEQDVGSMRPAIFDAMLKQKGYSGGRGRRAAYSRDAKVNALAEYLTDLMD